MDIAQMRSRITIYPIIQSTDQFGAVGTNVEPTPIGTFWCKATDTSSGSNYAHSQQQTVFNYKFEMRDPVLLTINTDCFIKWNDVNLKIEGIERKDEGKRRFLILRCNKIGE